MADPALVAVAARDDASRELLTRIVDRAGYRSVSVSVSATSLGELLAAAPALVVLDLDVEAPEVVNALRANGDPNVAGRRVVVLADGPAVGRRAWQAGTDAFLARPFHHDRFVATLRDVFDRPDAGREAVRRAGVTEYLG